MIISSSSKGPERATGWLEVPESVGHDIFLRLLTSTKMSISLKLFIRPATTHDQTRIRNARTARMGYMDQLITQ